MAQASLLAIRVWVLQAPVPADITGCAGRCGYINDPVAAASAAVLLAGSTGTATKVAATASSMEWTSARMDGAIHIAPYGACGASSLPLSTGFAGNPSVLESLAPKSAHLTLPPTR